VDQKQNITIYYKTKNKTKTKTNIPVSLPKLIPLNSFGSISVCHIFVFLSSCPSSYSSLLFLSKLLFQMDRFSSTTTTIPFALQGAKDDLTMQISLIWSQIKAPLIVPLLRISVFLCLIMSVMMFIERVYMGVVITLLKLFGRKPEKRYKWEPIKDDIELGNSCYPMVLVQIPMYNEREVLYFFILKNATLLSIVVKA